MVKFSFPGRRKYKGSRTFYNLSYIKEAKSATMNIFRNFYFLFKSFVKVKLSYVFTLNLFTIAENCTEK